MSRPMGPGGGPGGRFHQAEKIKNPKTTIKRLLGYMSHKIYALIIVCILCVISTIINVLATNYYGSIIDDYIVPHDLAGLKWICLFIAGIYFISVLATYLQNLIMVKLARNNG